MLTGKKIIIRPLEREDFKLLHRWLNDEETMRLGESYPDHMISMEGIEKQFEKQIRGEENEERIYVIQERRTGKAIGVCRIHLFLRRKRMVTSEIGLILGDRAVRGKGYGTDCSQLLLQECFEQLNLHRVEWWTNDGNTPSQKLARKLGFKEDGRFRESTFFDGKFHDMLCFGLLKHEYHKSKS